jgi:predicted methyltransferase
MNSPRQTQLAQDVWAQIIRPGDTCVDATCGNGHDTAFLAAAVGPTGRVWAVDVQPEALAATRATVEAAVPEAARPRVEYVLGCHSRIQEWAGSNAARVICFNLGYFPGGDKSITTTSAGTLAAAEAAFEVLAPGGVLSLLCYTGHPGGREEYDAVSQLVAALPPAYWTTAKLELLNRPTAPVLLLACKRPLR